jgi:hypothetical protein
MEKILKTQKFVSKAKHSLNKDMNRSLGSIFPKRILLAVLVLCVLAAGNTSCKKETNCPEGYNYDIQKNPPKSVNAAKSSDECDFERNEYQKADSLLTYVYHPDVRIAIGAATNGIEAEVWGTFRGYFPKPYDPSNHVTMDTVYGLRFAIRAMLNGYDPYPINDAELKILYNFCGTDSIGYDDMQTKYTALEDCENGVGIPEYEWVKDDCGGYWTTKTSKVAKP